MKSKTAQPWDDITKNPSEAFKEFFEAEDKFLIERMNKDTIFLDIGCGMGRTLRVVAPLVKKAFGIDNDQVAVDSSRKNLKKFNNVEVIFEDAEKMTFEDNYFDIVFTNSLGNFGETKDSILSEIKRIIKDDGLLVISIYNENALEERVRMYDQVVKFTIKDRERGTVLVEDLGVISEQFSKNEIEKILNDNGFKISDIKKGQIFTLLKPRKFK